MLAIGYRQKWMKYNEIKHPASFWLADLGISREWTPPFTSTRYLPEDMSSVTSSLYLKRSTARVQHDKGIYPASQHECGRTLFTILPTISLSARGSHRRCRRVWQRCFQTRCGTWAEPGNVGPWPWDPHTHIFLLPSSSPKREKRKNKIAFWIKTLTLIKLIKKKSKCSCVYIKGCSNSMGFLLQHQKKTKLIVLTTSLTRQYAHWSSIAAVLEREVVNQIHWTENTKPPDEYICLWC